MGGAHGRDTHAGAIYGAEWVFERKFDGILLLAFRQGRHVRLLSRNRLEQHHPRIAEAVANLPVREVILDGEITPLFPAMRHGKLTGREPLPPANVHMMIQRRTNRRRHSDKDLLSQLPRYRHHDLLPKRRQAGVAQQMAGDEAGSQVSRAQIAAGIAHL